MKRHRPIYTEQRLTFWPSYPIDIICICFLLILEFFLAVMTIWEIVEKSIPWLLIFALAGVSALITVVIRAMFLKITVTNTGFIYENALTKYKNEVKWDESVAVRFDQEAWRGRKKCTVLLKKESDQCRFVIPIDSIEIKRLLDLIPKELWENDPSFLL